jgi:hypothetical protein
MKKGEAKETRRPEKIEEKKPTEPAVRIKDKIDKEILSEILKNVVRPSESGPVVGKELNNKENKTLEKISNKDRGETKKEGHDTKNIPVNSKDLAEGEMVAFPTERNEKIITPENFKKVKQIHPHETVRVVSDAKTHDLSEGEEIKF